MRVELMQLPMPPPLDKQYGTTKTGGKYLTDEAKRFRRVVQQECLAQRANVGLRGPVVLAMIVCAPNPVSDLDNRLKALQDALEAGGVFGNDRQIDLLLVACDSEAQVPHVDVWVSPLSEAKRDFWLDMIISGEEL